MSLKVVLFDLDGTLLPMDQDHFIKTYITELSCEMARHGYDREEFTKALWLGIGAMMHNRGTDTNEHVFWEVFCRALGDKGRAAMPYLEYFYQNIFDRVSESCGFNAEAKRTVSAIKKMGLCTVLATNPVFPSIATEKRMKWAGLSPDDFYLVTSYENSSYSKPSLDYYREILKKLGVAPEECLMVGNDTEDDMTVSELGMRTFLVTECLINSKNKDISVYDKGTLTDLVEFVSDIIA